MATLDKTKQALATQEPVKPLRTMIEEASKELARALPESMRSDRLVRIALTNIRMVPQLANCSPESFLGALFTAAQLGIEPIAGRGYLLPFYNSKKRLNPKPGESEWHKVLEAQFILGYRGLIELFYRHEKSLMLNWGVVRAGDEFNYELGTQAFLKHKPSDKRGETLGFYVVADLGGHAKPFHYMTLAECVEHGKKHSKTYDKKKEQFYENSPWSTNLEAMCLKTVLIQLCKVLPLSFEIQQAVEQDEASHEYRKGVRNMFETPNTTSWNEPPQAIDAPKEKDPNDPGEPPPEGEQKSSEDIPFGK